MSEPENVFDIFMSRHLPVGELVEHANEVLWKRSALPRVLKERMRVALAEAIGCSYCARSRTDLDGETVLGSEVELSDADERRAQLLERFAVAAIEAGAEPPDRLVSELERHFDEAELSDVIFSFGWFAGMQHVGRVMHWDQACPVAPIRAMVEAGEAV